MAITCTNVVNFQNALNQSSYVTGSWTPTANLLYLCAVMTSGSNQTVSSFTDGTGLNWVIVDATLGTLVFNTSYRISVYRGMKASGLGAGTTQANLSGTVSRGVIIINEYAGINTGGTDGSAAIAQVNNANATIAVTALIITLLNSLGAGDATTGFFSTNLTSSTGITQGSGYTEISEVQPTAEQQDSQSEFLATGSLTVDITCISSIPGGIALELVAAAAASDFPITQDTGVEPINLIWEAAGLM